MAESRNILICPLDWGLGHASRMIPLARELIEMNHKVFFAGSDQQISLFRSELEGPSYIKFPGFRPTYSRFLPQFIPLLLITPVLLFHIILEHFRLKGIIKKYDINIVISDNRFGLWNSKVKTVYVTHMPLIPFPKPFRLLELIGIKLHRYIIKKYSFCFIPDLPGELNLSGRLSHGIRLPSNVRYVGILSRFSYKYPATSDNTGISVNNTIILSGPQPQRGMLREKLLKIFADKKQITAILEGSPSDEDKIIREGNFVFYNHLTSSGMMSMIKGSSTIIARSGYSTIMDLISMGSSALLIPTPGQTEQEYLADFLSDKGWFTSVKQNELKGEIQAPLLEIKEAAEIIDQSRILLGTALKELLEEPEE